MTCFVPVLLYGSESCTLLSSDSSPLEAFRMRCQREIFRLKWQDMIRNTAITEKTSLPSVTAIIDAHAVTLRCLAMSQDSRRHAPISVLKSNLRPPSLTDVVIVLLRNVLRWTLDTDVDDDDFY